MKRARDVAAALQLESFGDTLIHIKSVLWLEKPQCEDLFRSHWGTIFDHTDQSEVSDLSMSVSPYSSSVEYI